MRWSAVVRGTIVILTVLGAVIAVFARPPLPQPPAYHLFADHRAFLGIPNCLNVLSNLPLGIVGLLGLATVLGPDPRRTLRISDHRERQDRFIVNGKIGPS